MRIFVWSKVVDHFVGGRGDVVAPGCLEVIRHIFVVREHRASCANFGTHVADGGFTGRGNRVGTRTEVFDDGTCSSFHGKNPGDFQDHVLRARPARDRTSEFDADYLWPANIERKSRHHIHRVCAANADCHHTQSTRVRGVAVSSDHHSARECIVFEDNLVNDAATRSPKSDSVFG